MAKKKNTPLTPEELLELEIKRNIDDCRKIINNIGISENPKKIFNIGEQVTNGHSGIIECFVTEILEPGIYKVKFRYITNKPYSSDTIELVKEIYETWYSLFKISSNNEPIKIKDGLNINFHQQSIDSILLTYYPNFGLNMNPDYQRDLVWELKDKEKLIESIFNRVEIGKFVLIRLDYNENVPYSYEVLDGKQRINTLIEYFTDVFPFKGKYFSDLSFYERHHFTNYSISVATTNQELSEEQKLEYFLSLNTGGKQVSEEHLNNIKNKLNDLRHGI